MKSPFLRQAIRGALPIILVVAITLVICEAGYRIFLSRSLENHRTSQAKPPDTFGFYGHPSVPWVYDAEQGFRFNDGPWLAGAIVNGRFETCSLVHQGNKYGNAGLVWGDYEQADIKILLFGSSFTMIDGDGTGATPSNLLAKALSAKLGKKVAVLDFSRDATGMLAMFDIAGSVVGTYKPDLMLFTFNGSAFAYQRRWRVVKEAKPNFYRLFDTLDMKNFDDPRLTAVFTIPLTTLVTREWCVTMAEAKRQGDQARLTDDPVVKTLNEEYDELNRMSTRPIVAVDFYALNRSFIWNALVHQNPYYNLETFANRTIYAGVDLKSYRDDPLFMAGLDKIKRSKVPYLLLHIPTREELAVGGEPSFGKHGGTVQSDHALTESVKELTGAPYIALGPHYDPAVFTDPLKFVKSREDSHPNARGNEAMAEAMIKALMNEPTAAKIFQETGKK